MVITNLYENVIERLFLIGNAQPLERGLIGFQIIHYIDQLIGQIINEVSNNLTGEHELVSAVICIDDLTQPLIKLNSLNLVSAAISCNSLFEELEQSIEFCNR